MGKTKIYILLIATLLIFSGAFGKSQKATAMNGGFTGVETFSDFKTGIGNDNAHVQKNLAGNTSENKELVLWYKQPAANWNEALPIGNGRLGAMVYGIPEQENIQLNEETLWGGGPHRNDNPNANGILDEIRQLLFDGKYKEAHDMANGNIISKIAHGMPYETVGNLLMNFEGHDRYTNYYRELDISDAVSRTSYTVDGVDFQREVFTSIVDQVLVIRLSASKKGKISFLYDIETEAGQTIILTRKL
jgi:hypothetical protein